MSSASNADDGRDYAVSVRDLTYSFPSLRDPEDGSPRRGMFRRRQRAFTDALKHVSFGISTGECVALLGPNGAGKSTLIKTLAGILYPSSGHVQTLGLDPWKDRQRYRQQLGVVFGHRTQLWWDLPVHESLWFLATVYQISRAAAQNQVDVLTRTLQLKPLLRKPVRELSLGERMRCELAASLLHRPSLLLLDEPTIGLDILARIQLRDYLRAFAAEQRCTLILSSHDLLDVEGITNRLLVLESGKLIYDGSISSLLERLDSRRVSVTAVLESPVEEAVRKDLQRQGAKLYGPEDSYTAEHELGFSIDREKVGGALGVVAGRGDILDVRIDQPTIEDVVVQLLNQSKLA